MAAGLAPVRGSPTACPGGNGRVYFRLGHGAQEPRRSPRLLGLHRVRLRRRPWNGNTTQVDAFCIPITIDLGDKKLGITESRSKLFKAFRRAPPQGVPGLRQGRTSGSSRRAGPGSARTGPTAGTSTSTSTTVWNMYAKEKKTPSGKYTGKVVDGALTFTPVDGGKPRRVPRNPTTQEIFLGTGVLGGNPGFCAAINRHVLADPADWRNPPSSTRPSRATGTPSSSTNTASTTRPTASATTTSANRPRSSAARVRTDRHLELGSPARARIAENEHGKSDIKG